MNHVFWILLNAPPVKFKSPDGVAVVTGLYDSLDSAGDPTWRMCLLGAKMNFQTQVGKRDVETARAIVDFYLKSFKQPATDSPLPEPDPQSRDTYLKALAQTGDYNGYVQATLDTLLRKKDHAELLKNSQLVQALLISCEPLGRREIGYTWLERLLPVWYGRAELTASERAAVRQKLEGVNLSRNDSD